MKLFYHPQSQDVSLAGVLYALGDPVRLAIVRQLAERGELPCAGFAFVGLAPVPKSTLSHHFRVLRDAGVLACRKEGTQHMNSLRREELNQRFPGLLEAVLQCAEGSDRATDQASANQSV